MTPKSGQFGGGLSFHQLISFDPDPFTSPVIGQIMEVDGHDDVPMHEHVRGQLITTIRGTVRVETIDGMWPILPHTGLWIPPGQPHRSVVSSHAQIATIYVLPGAVRLPATACFLTLNPLLREMVVHVARLTGDYPADSRNARIAGVLGEELSDAPVDSLFIAMPHDPRLRGIATAIMTDPAERRTLPEWARTIGMSERGLRRHVERELGMSFGRWRQQFQLSIALRDLDAGMAIKSVSERLGYDSVSAFAAMFKKAMGRPPGHYSSQRHALRRKPG
ncbi:AraC family transcriptional regulator [Pseudogemmobacter sonorensis]|uniref:AraC family transcriptional regulator n=1 Tax=Pseudogemmobacter sonorensis TaxID=2989681 RepID=UPI003684B294